MHQAIIIGTVRSLWTWMGQIPRSTERISSFPYNLVCIFFLYSCVCILIWTMLPEIKAMYVCSLYVLDLTITLQITAENRLVNCQCDSSELSLCLSFCLVLDGMSQDFLTPDL